MSRHKFNALPYLGWRTPEPEADTTTTERRFPVSLPRDLSAAKTEQVKITAFERSDETRTGARIATFSVTTSAGLTIRGCMLIAGSGGRFVFKFPHRRIPGGYLPCVEIEDPAAAVQFENSVFKALRDLKHIA